MRIYTGSILLSVDKLEKLTIETLRNAISNTSKNIPIRVSLIEQSNGQYMVEVDFIDLEGYSSNLLHDIFAFQRRSYVDTREFNAALIIPTGVGAEIGGHCGDGNVVARLIASACDTLITHPNVVNASDINEMPSNTLYVEGSSLTRLLMGEIGLQRVYSNKILLVIDRATDTYMTNQILNVVSAARVTLGLDCDVLELYPSIESVINYTNSGRAAGDISHLERLFNVVDKVKHKYNAIGILTQTLDLADSYSAYMSTNENSVNPIGGIEAMLTHSLSLEFNLPFAHSPMEVDRSYIGYDFGIVDPRKASETLSVTDLGCILKGLFKSPKIVSPNNGLNVNSVSCLIQPDSCIGLATMAAIEQEIPIIAVKTKTELANNSVAKSFPHANVIVVENYLEAVGVMHAIKAGISLSTIKRPISKTQFFNDINAM